MKVRWLDRRIAWPGPFLCLCLSEAEYVAAMQHLGVLPADAIWCAEDGGKTHHISNRASGSACIVCICASPERTAVEVAGLLVHEAVHVWQEYCRSIGEHSPGVEQEAYGIQAIAQELMAEYARRAV